MASPPPPRLTPRERALHRTNLVLTGTLFGLTCLGMLGFAALAVVGNLAWDDNGDTRCDDAEFRPRTLERAEELADTDGWVDCTVYPYGTVSPVPSLG
jgi:hypothetical protein